MAGWMLVASWAAASVTFAEAVAVWHSTAASRRSLRTAERNATSAEEALALVIERDRRHSERIPQAPLRV